MKTLIAISRTILGFGFIVFGLNILHPFLPQPPFAPGSLESQFAAVMGPTHWMSAIGIFQLLGGFFVIIGRTAPLGLSLLAPVLVNILLFHLCVQRGSGIFPGLVMSLLELFLIYSYRSYFLPIFTTKARPTR